MTSGQARRAPAGDTPVAARWPAALPVPASKRLLDIVLACAVLVVLSPLLAVAALAVRLTTPGPALFRQVRLGAGRRPFVLCKFRTMYAGCPDGVHREYIRRLLTEEQPPAGEQNGLYKLGDDARITPLGRVLRRTSIDELPQLLNVVRGDMSLVGPRPALPWEADLIGGAHAQRFAVPPGITGLWQVSGRSSLSMRQALDLDAQYVATRSFLLDVQILARTIPVVLSTRGAL
jgi:lipopolysaccharide/colanic/teichoic acid biosynthesis glycosyltransferase